MMECLTADLPAAHGFFTRQGGVSLGAYASLNCGLSGADAPVHVQENRARVARAMRVAPECLLGVKQVHGAEVVRVARPWAAGDGPQADALVSDVPGLLLGIITADCAPVLFSAAGVVGAAHAGWRGALAGVLEATVAAMRAAGATEITAAIGPCIGQASYEVAADMRAAVLAHAAADERFFTAGRAGHWHFDLPGYCAARLAALGVAAQVVAQDTCAQPERFFSHRYRTLHGFGPGGHQISVIRL